MLHQYERVLNSLVNAACDRAARVGVGRDELLSAALCSATQAEERWDPERGRSLPSWIWINVKFDLGKLIAKEERAFALQLRLDRDLGEPPDEFEANCLMRDALRYLRARLAHPDWTALWMRLAEGHSCAEIADACGITLSAARKRVERSRRRAVAVLVEGSIDRAGGR